MQLKLPERGFGKYLNKLINYENRKIKPQKHKKRAEQG
jgi:hypothetical protein